MAWQVESQALEMAQSKVLGLASLDTRALLLLGPQSPFIDIGWCVGVVEMSSGPAHCIYRGKCRKVATSQPRVYEGKRQAPASTSSCGALSHQPNQPQLTCLSSGLDFLPLPCSHPLHSSNRET